MFSRNTFWKKYFKIPGGFWNIESSSHEIPEKIISVMKRILHFIIQEVRNFKFHAPLRLKCEKTIPELEKRLITLIFPVVMRYCAILLTRISKKNQECCRNLTMTVLSVLAGLSVSVRFLASSSWMVRPDRSDVCWANTYCNTYKHIM